MRHLFAAVALACAVNAGAAPRPFDAHDLVMMDRVSDPQLSPDGRQVLYQLRETDYAANKGTTGIWLLDLAAKNAQPVRLTDKAVSASSPRWSADGKSAYFLAKGGEAMQLWQRAIASGSAPVQVTRLALDVNNYKLSPSGRSVLLSLDVFTDCADLACSKKRLDDRAANKASGTLYDKLFIRHWDSWADGRRSQLFVADFGADGGVAADPKLLTRGIDGDVASKPFGDDGEYAFSADGKTVYFDVRIAGTTEPWSTNFDIYSVPSDGSAAPSNLTAANPAWDTAPLPSADGKTLYYLAMKRAGFEADRFGIMALDLASGKTREIDPQWDRSAGGMQLSKDGKVIYVSADDNGDHAIFAVDIASGKAKRLNGLRSGRRIQCCRQPDRVCAQHAESAGRSVPHECRRQQGGCS